MLYLRFSLLFFVVHFVCYIIAGVIDFQLAQKMYSGKDRLYKSFFRNMEDKQEAQRIGKLLFPSQLIRAILMSAVLYPVLPFLTQLSFGMQFLFMSTLMFVYADFSSAIPFSNTIEGLVYLKKEFVQKKVFWTIQFEAIIYSLLFGLFSALIVI
ncbi:hypothetical protein CHISP_0945 [Chitinispirillum alkaliphilum]|nr:hypothetical protein CHISP_0945 [Chitinispirillum alkaliphilum]